MNTIILPDGYIGGTVECDTEPILIDGNLYKLQVKNKPYIKWCTREQYEDAMYQAFIQEAYGILTKEQQEIERNFYKKEMLRKETFEEDLP